MDAIPVSTLWTVLLASAGFIVVRKSMSRRATRRMLTWGLPVDPGAQEDTDPIAATYIVLGVLGVILSAMLLILKYTVG